MQRPIRNRDRERLSTEGGGGATRDDKKVSETVATTAKEMRRRDVAREHNQTCGGLVRCTHWTGKTLPANAWIKPTKSELLRYSAPQLQTIGRLIFRIRHSRRQVVNGHSFLFATALIRCHSRRLRSQLGDNCKFQCDPGQRPLNEREMCAPRTLHAFLLHSLVVARECACVCARALSKTRKEFNAIRVNRLP